MFRNLVCKLPSITRTELHQRNFRSLSPPVKFSQNKTKSSSETSISSKSVNGFNTYNKEHLSANKNEKENLATKEIKWREEPEKANRIKTDKKTKELKIQESAEVKEEEMSPPQVQYCEQFELEAARPRPAKSREILDKLKRKPSLSIFGSQLQPNDLQPFGSQTNVYSYNLIASTSSRFMQKKLNKKEIQDKTNLIQNTSKKPYSTSIRAKDVDAQELDSGKIKDSTLRTTKSNFDYSQRPKTWNCKKTWDISPPTYKNVEDDDFVKFSSEKAYRQRREEANKNTGAYYKKSYSDLVKLRNEQASNLESLTNNQCIECKENKKSENLLDSQSKLSTLTLDINKRNMSTLCGKKSTKNWSSPLGSKNETEQHVNYSKSISKNKNLSHKEKEKCYDICKEEKKKQKFHRLIPQLEPEDCQGPPKSNKVFLSSKLRLPVVKCLPKFEYPCPIPQPCPPRADECLKLVPKRLPPMIPQECPCVEKTFIDVPKLKRLCFDFKDPPREHCPLDQRDGCASYWWEAGGSTDTTLGKKCYQELCTIPRADEKTPYKFKPLRPLEMGECKCVEPPSMTDVKLKRLPPCQPDEVCRPIREPCVPVPCPPRADDNLKVLKKR